MTNVLSKADMDAIHQTHEIADDFGDVHTALIGVLRGCRRTFDLAGRIHLQDIEKILDAPDESVILSDWLNVGADLHDAIIKVTVHTGINEQQE